MVLGVDREHIGRLDLSRGRNDHIGLKLMGLGQTLLGIFQGLSGFAIVLAARLFNGLISTAFRLSGNYDDA